MQTGTIKSVLYTLTVALLLLFGSVANASAEPPDVMLESVSHEMISTLKREREAIRQKPVRLFDLVDAILSPHVDMERMSRWVLGKHWRTATKEQREHFTREFKTLLVRFYTSALLDDPEKLDELLDNLDEGIITFQPTRIPEDAEQVIVKAAVHLKDRPEIPVSFRLYQSKSGGEWKVIDISVEGISLVTTYRNTFASEISRDGLDALLNRLSERNRELLENSSTPRTKTQLTSNRAE